MRLAALFRSDPARHEGVRPVHILLLRIFFFLVVVFVGFDAWSSILGHEGPWDHVRAAALSMWAGFALVSVIGVYRPLTMLPLVLFDIVYKPIWLAAVAYPLWSRGELAGSPAEEMTYAFLWVLLPIVAMPWGYARRRFLPGRRG